MDKKTLRNSLLQTRKEMPEAEHKKKSTAISKNLITLDSVKNAKIIAVYLPINNEVETKPFISAMRQFGKQIVVPVMDSNTLKFAFFEEGSELKKNSFGVEEPNSPKFVSPVEIEVFIIPGSAFDLSGNRLGYGKGFFDKFFNESKTSGLKVGVCFGFQLIKEGIPFDDFDVKMDLVVTEFAVYK